MKYCQKHFVWESSRVSRQSFNNTPIQLIPSASPQNPLIEPSSNEAQRQKPKQSFKRQFETRSYPIVLDGAICYTAITENKLFLGNDVKNFLQKTENKKLSVRCTESLMNLPSTTKSKDQKHPRGELKESHDSEEARILLRDDNNEKLKCRYKVVFKTSSNADTKLIVNPLKNKKCTSEKNIPRCYRDDNLCDTNESFGYVTLGLKNEQHVGSYHKSTSKNKHCTLP